MSLGNPSHSLTHIMQLFPLSTLFQANIRSAFQTSAGQSREEPGWKYLNNVVFGMRLTEGVRAPLTHKSASMCLLHDPLLCNVRLLTVPTSAAVTWRDPTVEKGQRRLQKHRKYVV